MFELAEAINEHDRTRFRAALADDFVFADHRPARLGLIEGADAWAESWAVLLDLAPDAQIAIGSTLAYARNGSVGLGRTFGTLRDGGTFENPYASVSIVVDGRITRIEMFEPEHVDTALARFAELRPDPLRIPPNAATRAHERWIECVETRDWDALRALVAPIVWEDRRRLIRTTGDCDMAIAHARLVAWSGARESRTLLATSGDRLALQHFRWKGTNDGGPFEIDILEVSEVDAEGRIVASIVFDPDDRRAASLELLDRYTRSDTSRWAPRANFEFRRALIDQDLDLGIWRVRCPREQAVVLERQPVARGGE